MIITSANAESIQHREYYEDALRFYMRKLLPHNKRVKCITIEYFPTLLESFEYTASIHIDTEYFHKPKQFRIYVEPELDTADLLLTLAHEAVHIKQYALGELSEIAGFTVWKGSIYEDTLDAEYETYRNYPWEIEAWDAEESLKMSFLRQKMGAL